MPAGAGTHQIDDVLVSESAECGDALVDLGGGGGVPCVESRVEFLCLWTHDVLVFRLGVARRTRRRESDPARDSASLHLTSK